MRVVCLFVPAFPLAAWCRVDPELRGRGVVIVDGGGARARIVAVSAEAERCGVTAAMSAAEAAAGADLVVRVRSAEAERAAQAALCDVADACSPRVEEQGAGVVYLDGEGLAALHGTEEDLARDLVRRARQVALETSIGIASSKVAAFLAAREGGGVTVIRREEEWSFLAPLSLRWLEPSPSLRRRLERWGIRRFADLAALPMSDVVARLGPEAALLARRARGEDEHPLVARPAPLCFEEGAELDYGVESLEPFLFILRGLLDRLTARLALRGFLCGDLRLLLEQTHGGRDERRVVVAAPTNEVKPLLALIRLQLEARPPSAPVAAVRMAAVPERLRAMQLDLFRPNGPAPERFAVTLARLAALCGADRVGIPAVADSHRPDAYAVVECDASGAGAMPNAACGTDDAAQRLALRAIRPPRALEVFTNRGQLDFVRPAAAVCDCPPPRSSPPCTGRVVTASGPWRISGEWWHDGAFVRDYYDVQLSDGAVYRLFYDRQENGWFVDGVYD